MNPRLPRILLAGICASGFTVVVLLGINFLLIREFELHRIPSLDTKSLVEAANTLAESRSSVEETHNPEAEDISLAWARYKGMLESHSHEVNELNFKLNELKRHGSILRILCLWAMMTAIMSLGYLFGLRRLTRKPL